jgi:hypothetical protein
MDSHLKRLVSILVFAGSVFGAGTAAAVDGVTEINNTSIMAAGGYPFAIAASGSYVLTSNLTPPAATGALVVAAPNVTLDLNGFDVIGSLGGAAVGISGVGAGGGLTVRDGTIENFSGAGISVDTNAKILRTTIRNNGAGIALLPPGRCLIVENTIIDNNAAGGTNVGIEAGDECKIENNVIAQNDGGGIACASSVIVHNEIIANGAGAGQGGILCFDGCTIQENVIRFNSDYGISDSLGPAAALPFPSPPGTPFPAFPVGGGPSPNVILKNTIDGTAAGYGIYANTTAVVSHNSVSNNGLEGILCGGSCTIVGNQVNSNNLTGGTNGGVTAGPGSTVNDNSISFNFGVGLTIDPAASYKGNNLTGNTDPLQDSTIALPTPGGPHPTSGSLNACGGALAPNARCP